MTQFNDLRLGVKMTVLAASAALILVIVGFIAYTQMDVIYDNTRKLSDVRLPGTDLLLQVDRDMQQSLVAQRSLFAAPEKSDRLEGLKEECLTNIGQAEERWKKYSVLPKTVNEKNLLPLYDNAFERWKRLSEDVVNLVESGTAAGRDRALLLSYGECGKAFEESRDVIDKLTEVVETEAQKEIAVASEARSDAVVFLAAASFVGILLIVLFGIAVNKAITGPIGIVVRKMANADLAFRFNSNRKDEIGDLQRSFDDFVGALRDTLVRVSESSAAVASASTEISSSTEELAAGAQEQSSQATEVAGAVEEMTKTIVENSKNAGNTADAARKAKSAAEEGVRISGVSLDAIRRNVEIAGAVGSIVNELGSSSGKIGEIITVIDDIADQTNLLALNAAIEAARAGEQGRGFAVVADEVRKLAERTTRATKEIAELIRGIQQLTDRGVSAMGKAGAIVAENRDMTQKTAEALRNIVDQINQVTDMVGQIAAASEQQSSASEQISKNVEAISTVTQQSASGTQQIARTAEDLNRLTENLQQLLEKFHLEGSTHAFVHEPLRKHGEPFQQRKTGVSRKRQLIEQ